MAVKSIKGITIEIAGDTTKLGKALKGVDEKSKDLAASLKYVDKLLDFDPGNTELLTEKQKLLTESVENTCEKLETLKSVQDQIKQQYASGEIGQRAYLDFRAEVARTERQLRDLYSESDRVGDSLDDTGNEARGAAGDLGRLGGSANASAGELGGLDDAIGSLITGGKIAAVGAAIAGAVSAIGEIVEETQEYREEMAKLDIAYASARLSGEAAETAYRNLYRVLGETDQSVEAAQQIALLSSNTEQVALWSGLAAGLVARFGDALQPETFYESANETLKLNEATGAFVQLLEGTGVISVEDFNKRLQELNDEEAKQAYMLGVTKLLLGNAAEAYEERNKSVLEARDADARWEAAMADVGEALSPLATDAKNFGADIVEWFVPKLQAGVDILGDLGTAFSDMGTTLKEDWQEVTAWFDDKWTAFTDGLKSVNDSIREFFDGTSDVTSLAEQNLGQNFAAMSGHMATAAEQSGDAAQTFYDPWIGVGASFSETCEGLYASYNKAVTNIENRQWTVPKPKLPHFSIAGEFSFGHPPTVPKVSVSMFAKGGILTGPTIFGALGENLLLGGEAGQEAVLPLSSFYTNLERILARNNAGGKNITVGSPQIVIYAQQAQDLDALTDQLADKFTIELERRLSSLG